MLRICPGSTDRGVGSDALASDPCGQFCRSNGAEDMNRRVRGRKTLDDFSTVFVFQGFEGVANDPQLGKDLLVDACLVSEQHPNDRLMICSAVPV